jgi:hypothetical protein
VRVVLQVQIQPYLREVQVALALTALVVVVVVLTPIRLVFLAWVALVA